MAQHTFNAELWQYDPGEASWHFLTLPAELSGDIRVEAGPRRGFGSVRVEARIGDSTWRTSLFPDAKRGTFLLPVRKPVRVAEGLEDGERCDVTVEVIR